jgi:MFS transporter, DHA1 family, multidrug resistance protein
MVALFFLPETFSPMILQWKAAALRKETGDHRFKSQHELQDPFWAKLKTNVTRPIIFFLREPIVVFVGFYLILIYVLVFTFLDGFTFIFVDTYGFSDGLRGTTFLAIAVGVFLNVLTMPIFRKKYLKHLRDAEEAQDRTGPDEEGVLEPEVRLWPAIFCAPLFPISLFWMAWTNYASISPGSDIGAACLFGFSLTGIFVSSYQYVIDSYETNSASVISSITFLRYIVAGGMVIADTPMYQGIGVHWTLTLMGCLGTVLVPMPFVFWKYGRKIRSNSKFAKRFN